MLAYRKTVEEIQAYLNSPDQTADEKIRELASRYAAVCREINDRLRQCQVFVEQGFRSQAILLAEVEPNLLDTIALLDFTERDEWEEVAATYGWDRVFGLKLDAADQINQAYEIEEELRPLLKQHRKLALAHAPLQQRIEVLRQIAGKDASVVNWQEDLTEYEKARIHELFAEGKAALAANDLATLDTLLREWQHTPWAVKIPRTVSEKMEGLFVELATRQILPKLSSDIIDARKTADVARLQELRSQWDQLTKRIRDSGSDWKPASDLSTQVSRIFDWLNSRLKQSAHEKSQRQAIETLEDAMAEGEPLEEIEALVKRLRSFYAGGELPPHITDNLKKYRWRQRANIAGQIAMWLVGLVGGLVVLFIILQAFLKSR